MLSPTIYLDLRFAPQAKFVLGSEYEKRAIYTVTSGIKLDGEALEQHRQAIIAPKSEIEITADT